MPSHDIPFFNDLPTKAVAPATKLWDAAKSPSYNFMAAYSAFVEHCNDVNIAPPVRPVVKRFVAGVQAGMIDRPGGDTVPAQAAAEDESQALEFEDAFAYFANLPPTTASALQGAWDRASAGGFESRFMYETFFRDITALGYAGPTRAEFDTWIKGIVKGEIERPARQISSTAASPVLVDASIASPEAGEPVQSETAQSPTPETRPWLYQHKARDERAHRRTTAEPFIPLTPSNFPLRENPLGLLVEKAVQDKTAALQANARDYARKLIAEHLRELADELESAS